MNALLSHLGISLRLHFRNKLGLLYGYLFPLIFLVAFGILYRHETIPLLRHMGELLTVAVLGGVAVPLAALPLWAQHLSAFFPGRYAVAALQAGVSGRGLADARFSLLALGLTGIAGCLAGARLFRWDAHQRFATLRGKLWLLPALTAWVAVGLLAEWRGRSAVPVDALPAAPSIALPAGAKPPATRPATKPPALAPATRAPARPEPPWTQITPTDWDGLDYWVPPDHGLVSPMAAPDEAPEDFVQEEIDRVRNTLAAWPPGTVGDDLACIRNLLYIAAIPDVLQLPVERHLPRVVYQHLLDHYPKEKLIKILTYIVLHPLEGPGRDSISDLGIEGAAGDQRVVRERAYFYAIKFIARLTGRIRE